MALTNRLVNPTPFDVKFPYDRGVNIHVPAYGETDLSIAQMDDFRDGKPGSEEVKHTLHWYGLFLNDSDLSYDVQALDALKASLQEKKVRFNEFMNRLRDGRSSQGIPVTEETLEESVRQAGYASLRDQMGILTERIKTLEAVVSSDPTRGRIGEQLDPARTCFGTSPPRTFPSETALKMFLEDNPELKEKQEELLKEMDLG